MKRLANVACALTMAAAMSVGLAGCSQEEYKPAELTPTVSSSAVAQDGVLKVGISGGAPFVIETSSSMEGLDVDFAAALADSLGLTLELVTLNTDEAAIEEALLNGEVDMVMGVSQSTQSENLWVSDSYIETGVVLFGAEGSSVPDPATAESLPMIAAQDSSTSAWAVTNSFGEACIVSSSDLMSAFSSYESGVAQYVAADAVIGSYVVSYQNLDVVPVALLGQASGYCVAVAASNTELQEAVSGALTSLAGNGIAEVLTVRCLGTTLDLSALPIIETSLTTSSQDASAGEGDSDSAGSGSTAGANAVTQ